MVGSGLFQGTLWFIFIIPRKNIWKDIKKVTVEISQNHFFYFEKSHSIEKDT